jgi:hypothetical protein
MSEHNGWTLEAIFQLGGGVQVAVASTVPLRKRDWYRLKRMLEVTVEVVEDQLRLDAAKPVTAAASAEPVAAAAGDIPDEI